MTRTELVAEVLDVAKPRLLAYWDELPAHVRQRLDGMEGEIGGLMALVAQGVWALLMEHLSEQAEREGGKCGLCGRKCSKNAVPAVEVVVLGRRIKVPVDYYYCRRCHVGRAPLRQWLGVHEGSASSGFMRALISLCLLRSFGKGAAQMKEQHGQEVDRTRAQRVTYQVGQEAQEYLGQRRNKERARVENAIGEQRGVDLLTLMADGGGVPVGELRRPTPQEAKEFTDKRKLPKGKREQTTREVRLITVHPPECKTERVVDLHLAPLGQPEVSGERMYASTLIAGAGDNTRVHGVFDMGTWIRTQFGEQFPQEQHTACADFFHTDEYLGGAAKALYPGDENQRGQWLSVVSHWLKRSETDLVMQQLAAHICRAGCPKDEHGDCLANVALRYMQNWEPYMDYARFVAEELPIGSGEAEGGIRHLVRRRLDIPGAWREDHVDMVCALLAIEESGWWEDFWHWRDQRDIQRFQLRQEGKLKATTFRGRPRASTPAEASLRN